MNKKLFLNICAMAAMMFASSCSEDVLVNETPGADGYVTASFTIATDNGISTRTVGDGSTVDKVACAVYDAQGNEMRELYDPDLEIDGKKAQYNIRLVKGQAYRVAFFAYNSEAKAYNVEYLTNVTFNDNKLSNVEGRDAFTGYADVTATESMNAINKEVTLYRPFAQLNLGIDETELADARKAGVVIKQTSVKVSNVYNAFSAYDNKVVEGAVAGEMEFAMNDIPTEVLNVTVDGVSKAYTYLALNYLLVGDADAEKSLTDVEFSWVSENGKTNEPTSTFINIPVQRNYRTNIIGKLLTNPAEFNITIDADFKENDHIVEIWDGKTVTKPEADADNVIRIKNAAEFVGLMETTGNSIYLGKTIELQCNIDLANNTVKGIGSNSSNFAGVFDGNGFSVSNFTIDATGREYYAGLFNQVSHGGTVKNLIVKNATIKGNSMVGAVASSLDDKALVENCQAINCTLIGVKKVGSVVGYSAGSTVKDCYAEKCVIEYSEMEAGAVLGFENTGSTVTNNTSKDITFKTTAAVLAQEMTPADGVINLTHDYTVVDDWTSQTYSGTITINGNGHTINGLNKPLLAGQAADILTVNELTIANSQIGVAANENGLGTGAFICYMDGKTSVSFNDCHLVNSKVTGNERAGGLIAYSSTSGSVSIENCTVVESEITSVGGSAGFIAYSQAAVSISDSEVKKSTVTATEDRTPKGNAVAGAAIGTINDNQATLSKVTVDDATTVNNTGAEPYSKLIGRLYGSATLTIDGKAMVSSQTALADALQKGETAISLGEGNYDLSGLTFTADNVVIEGNDKDGCVVTISKQLRIDGKSLTLKNLTTDVATGKNYDEHNFGWIHYANNFSMINCKSNGRIRLNCKATIENCEFNVTTSSGFDGYAIFYYGPSESKVKVSNCTFNTVGKAIVLYNEGTPVLNLEVEGCTFNSSDNTTDKAAIQMHTEHGITGTVTITNSTATGFANVNGGLWNELNNNTKVATDNFDITVDGTKVH